MLLSHRERGLYEGKVRVVGNDSLGERGELNPPCLPSSRILLKTFATVPCRLYSTGLICTAAALMVSAQPTPWKKNTFIPTGYETHAICVLWQQHSWEFNKPLALPRFIGMP